MITTLDADFWTTFAVLVSAGAAAAGVAAYVAAALADRAELRRAEASARRWLEETRPERSTQRYHRAA